MMMVVQVITGVRLTGCDAVRWVVVVAIVVVVAVSTADKVLKTKTRSVGHLVQTASIHHRQGIKRGEDLLI